jgi:hypothetical protein
MALRSVAAEATAALDGMVFSNPDVVQALPGGFNATEQYQHKLRNGIANDSRFRHLIYQQNYVNLSGFA